jgi:ParB-like chromosome segregation protein Spo0J
MAKEKEPPAVAKRETQAETRPTKVRLNEFVLQPERYSHRSKEEFKKERLKALMDSLVSEGQQVPIEFFRDKDGRPVVLKGHRRVYGERYLADDHVHHFTHDMEVDALEVVNATPEDRLLRSVLDNVNRATLGITDRMKAAKVLFDNGIDSARAAFALGISPKQLGRDLRVAREGWLLQHIDDQSITAASALKLLDAADEAGRVVELKEDLDAWIAEKKKATREKERLRKAQTGKDLKPAEKAVKNQMPAHLVEHWVELLRKGKRFDDDAQWNFPAGIEAETGQLRIASVNLDLKNAPLEDVAKVAAKLGKLTQDILPFLESRSLMETGRAVRGQFSGAILKHRTSAKDDRRPV